MKPVLTNYFLLARYAVVSSFSSTDKITETFKTFISALK